MAASLDDLTSIANNSGFQGRCMQALRVAAGNVMSESVATASHDRRTYYAVQVINGSVTPLNVAGMVLTNTTISGEAVLATTPDFAIPDGDIQFTINSLFNALAGIAAQS